MNNPISDPHPHATHKRLDSITEAQSIIRQQAYDLKLLSNDNQLKAQQIEMLREKVRELEESSNGYQTQVSVLEESLNISNHEFKAKWQAEQAQSLKLSKNNKALLRTNQQLQQYIKELEQRQISSQENLQDILGEVQGLKQRSTQAQQAVIQSKEILVQKQKELEMADAAIVRLRVENEELKNEISRLEREKGGLEKRVEGLEGVSERVRSENGELHRKVVEVNSRVSVMEKEIENKRRELEELGDVRERYLGLKNANERDVNELASVRHNGDLLKRKYEDLQHEHESKMIMFEQVEGQIKLQNARIEGMEKQLEKFKMLAEEKEEENVRLGKRVGELEEMGRKREGDAGMNVRELKRLLEEQVIDEIEEEVDDEEVRMVMMGIVRQNRELADLNEKCLVSEEEYKYLEKEVLSLSQEKEELAARNEELVREYQILEEAEEMVRREKEEIQVKFDMELEKITNILHANEGHLDSAMQSKENEIQALLQEREKATEMLEAQEMIAREAKAKFLALAEEASLQKGRLERISYVLVAMLKVFLNLLVKFKALGKHKDFLGKYFWKYRTLRQTLEEMPIVKDEDKAGKSERNRIMAIKKFKRAVMIVTIIARLRRLKRKGRDNSVDEYEVMSSLDNMPEDLRRFICELFKYDRLGVEKGMLKDIQASLSSFDGLNENSVVGAMISRIGLLKNPEVDAILSEWSSRGISRSYVEGSGRKYIGERSPYGKSGKRVDNEKGREYSGSRRSEDMPRQSGSREYGRRNGDFIKEFDSLREESGQWVSENKIDELSEGDGDGDVPPLNERVNRGYGSNTLNYRRDEYKTQKQTHEYRQKSVGGPVRNSLWGGHQVSIDEYSTPGFNSPGEGSLSERKGYSRKLDSLGL